MRRVLLSIPVVYLPIFLFFYTLIPSAFADSLATVRVPMCLQFPANKTYVPCTGVVPVDPVTGNVTDWASALKGSVDRPSSNQDVVNGAPVSDTNPLPVKGISGPTTAAPVGNAAPPAATFVGGKDPSGNLKGLAVDTSGALNVVCPTCTGTGSGSDQVRRSYWNESNTPLAAGASYSSTPHDNGGTTNGGATRWNSFSCFASADQPGTVYLQASNDGASWFLVQTRSISLSSPTVYLSQPLFTKYWRCTVTNGNTDQTVLYLNSSFGM